MFLPMLTFGSGCQSPEDAITFGDDLAFLSKHTTPIVLADETHNAQVVVSPDYQGRVMTSTATGEDGPSFGWINRELIASGEYQPHINPIGGEDRFWIGPEGGQFSIFFKGGDPFDLEHWQTPAPIDWGAWEVVAFDSSSAHFRSAFSLTNYSGTNFDLEVNRHVRLLNPARISKHLGLELAASVNVVAYESENRITNTGSAAWTRDTGLLSVWILGMFNPSPATTVVIPFKPDAAAKSTDLVNDAYFGKVPANRLVVRPADGVLFFSGDGQYRSKIGLAPGWALPICASYDADGQVLTIVQFTLPEGATDYVNSMWELQDHPYAGDVSNSYNDGPPAPGVKPLGPFYELESSSPALALAPGATGIHIHRTFHIQGPPEELDIIAQATLGVSLKEITTALK